MIVGWGKNESSGVKASVIGGPGAISVTGKGPCKAQG